MRTPTTAEALSSDSTVKDMAQDLKDSMAYGDTIRTWFTDEGKPHAWFVEAAVDEYAARTGNVIDGDALTEALYALATA